MTYDHVEYAERRDNNEGHGRHEGDFLTQNDNVENNSDLVS